MDNQKNTPIPDDDWFDKLLQDIPREPAAPAVEPAPAVTEMPDLTQPNVGAELGPDEQAVSAAGLTAHEDLQLEQIIRETRQEAEQASAGSDAVFTEAPIADAPAEEETPAEEIPAEEASPAFFWDTSEQEPRHRQVIGQDAMLEASEEDEEPTDEEPEQTERKGRPRRKKGYGLFGIPHIVVTGVWIAIAVFIGMSLGRLLWLCAADVLALGKESMEVHFVVEEGDDIPTIAQKLQDAGLIEYPFLFEFYADISDAANEIAPGSYTLNTKYDYNALVNFMTPHAPTRESVEVLIPEGYTCAQIFSLLEEKGVCSVEELEKYAAKGELGDYWFLKGVVRGTKYCLEGYLFPDTYQFYINDDPGRVIGKFLSNFDYRFTDVMKEKLEPLNEKLAATLKSRGYGQQYIDEHKITYRDIVIIASMIEKETANAGESYTISSVIYNRLTNPAKYPFLNIDATIIYALDGNIDPETGKAKPLTREDLQMDHPYNTYVYKGLIPGPISNPGRNSLDAALDPIDTDYYYYVYDPSNGSHLFSRNEWEHENNKSKVG